jgi:hypothetical protein
LFINATLASSVISRSTEANGRLQPWHKRLESNNRSVSGVLTWQQWETRPSGVRRKFRSPRAHVMLHGASATQRSTGAVPVGTGAHQYNHHRRASRTADTEPRGAGIQRIGRNPHRLMRDCCSGPRSRLSYYQHQAIRKTGIGVRLARGGIITRQRRWKVARMSCSSRRYGAAGAPEIG